MNSYFSHGAARLAFLLMNFACLMAALMTGCVPGPTLTGDGVYAANTSRAFRENRIFYLGKPETVGCCEIACVPASIRPLEPIYQSPSAETADTPVDRAATLKREADAGNVIPSGSPLSVLVSQVRIPEAVSGPVDVAVVLDIFTGETPDEQRTSLVVFYQRDVRGGMTLNFNNLLVYSTDRWDAAYPPYFRLRVLDVKTERNNATAVLLDGASDLAQSLGDVIPSPYIPGINLAIKAAKLILANQQNQVIIDYQVQFYSADFVNAAGTGADLGVLKRGGWIVVGRPRGEVSRFWRTPLVLDRQTGELFDARTIPVTPGPSVIPTSETVVAGLQSPYILMTTVPYSAKVYGLVQERSIALLRLLTSRGQGAIDPENLSDSVAMSVRTFVLIREVRQQRTMDAVEKLVTAIGADLRTDASGQTISTGRVDSNALKSELRILLPKEGISELDGPSFPVFKKWWDDNKGNLVFDPEKYKLIPKGTK